MVPASLAWVIDSAEATIWCGLMAAVADERRLQRFRRDLGAVAGKAFELEAAAEEFRRAAFVGGDVGIGVTEHDAPWRRDLRQRQRIGGRPGRHQERRHLALEDFGQAPLDAQRPIVIAVAERIARVRRHDGVEDGRGDRRRVVGGEVHF